MIHILARCAALACLLFPATSMAEPITLKLAYYSSNRSAPYLSAVKPFVDAVNTEGKGVLRIDVHFSGSLVSGAQGRDQRRQAQLLLDRVADIAYVIPGVEHQRFSDHAVIELPGLYRDMREATLVHTRLAAANALTGYEPFFVLGAFGSEPETFHTRPTVKALDDLRGMTVRVNNPTSGLMLDKLGIKPVVMPIQPISSAISSGTIDGALVTASMLFEFGIGRVATHHYMLPTGSAPIALLMSRKTFEDLPPKAQSIVRRFSGDWTAARFLEIRSTLETGVIRKLKSDSRRSLMSPSPQDMARAQAVFKTVAEQVAAESPRKREALARVKAELEKLRADD